MCSFRFGVAPTYPLHPFNGFICLLQFHSLRLSHSPLSSDYSCIRLYETAMIVKTTIIFSVFPAEYANTGVRVSERLSCVFSSAQLQCGVDDMQRSPFFI